MDKIKLERKLVKTGKRYLKTTNVIIDRMTNDYTADRVMIVIDGRYFTGDKQTQFMLKCPSGVNDLFIIGAFYQLLVNHLTKAKKEDKAVKEENKDVVKKERKRRKHKDERKEVENGK